MVVAVAVVLGAAAADVVVVVVVVVAVLVLLFICSFFIRIECDADSFHLVMQIICEKCSHRR